MRIINGYLPFLLLLLLITIIKNQESVNYTPIKIKIDYSNFQKPDSMSEETYINIKNSIENTTLEFQKFLKVQHIRDRIILIEEVKNNCSIIVDHNFEKNFIEYDTIIFPKFLPSTTESYIAKAGSCYYDEINRPLIGLLYINNEKINFDAKNSNIYTKTVLLHEMTHILVFNKEVFKRQGMTYTIEEDNKEIRYINTPKVLEKARKHFNCELIQGLPLEDQGGPGSAQTHWEARVMLGDYMIAQSYFDLIISDITLALFEDTGFYKVDYFSGGLFKYGKNQGCDFLNKSCIISGKATFKEEFCSNNKKPFCSQSRTNKGYCYNTLTIVENGGILKFIFPYKFGIGGPMYFNDNCPISYSEDKQQNSYYYSNCHLGASNLHEDYGEKIGENSFCFESSLLPISSNQKENFQTICYEVKCDNEKKQIIVKIGSLSVSCPTYGKTLYDPEGFKGYINCPKYIDICNSDVLCNELYDCLDKKSSTDENNYYYNYNKDNNENINTDSSSQIFTVVDIELGILPCFKAAGSFTFYINGIFSKEVNILDKVNINLSTSSGKRIKSVCTPFDKTKYSKANLQCDIDISMYYPLEDEDIYLPLNPPEEKGYKFKNWENIIGVNPGESNVIKMLLVFLKRKIYLFQVL